MVGASCALTDLQWGPAVTDRRRERILTVPNLLSLGRVVASPVVGALILHGRHGAALSLFVAVGVTDYLDGWIARRWNQQTVLGTILDPFADKLLMTIMTVTLGMTGACRSRWTPGAVRGVAPAYSPRAGLLPLPLAALIVTRDVGLVASGFVLRYLSLAPPRTWGRYWDFKLPTAEVRPSTVSKVNTGLQLLLMGASLGAPVFGLVGHPALPVLWWSVAGAYAARALALLRPTADAHRAPRAPRSYHHGLWPGLPAQGARARRLS
jgi:cardiolipin synthase (CMP-forming)